MIYYFSWFFNVTEFSWAVFLFHMVWLNHSWVCIQLGAGLGCLSLLPQGLSRHPISHPLGILHATPPCNRVSWTFIQQLGSRREPSKKNSPRTQTLNRSSYGQTQTQCGQGPWRAWIPEARFIQATGLRVCLISHLVSTSYLFEYELVWKSRVVIVRIVLLE